VIIISLETQRAYAYRNGLPIGISTVSTGKAGHRTPTGVFTILQKNVDHKSNLYNNAPMPYMQRLTWDGIALHAGNLPGYPASHGCVRLPLAFAKKLYSVTQLGLTVVVTDKAEAPRIAPSPDMFDKKTGHLAVAAAAPASGWTWQPQRAPSGPISLVISGADKRLLVLRNGVLIGSTPVGIAGAVTGATAYTLRAIDGDQFHWLQLALPGQTVGLNAELPQSERDRLTIPEDFRRQLAAALKPGTTVVVTPDSLSAVSTGNKLTVMASGEE
jgi:hypothetical protein